MNDLHIANMTISRDVVASIVEMATEKVEGVAHVGQDVITSSLISVFNATTPSFEPAVEVEVKDDKFVIHVRVAVFFGYKFTEIAQSIREAVALAVKEQIGAEVSSVDVSIESLVFPKE